MSINRVSLALLGLVVAGVALGLRHNVGGVLRNSSAVLTKCGVLASFVLAQS